MRSLSRIIGLALVGGLMSIPMAAQAVPVAVYDQGFETDTSGWVPNPGTIHREPSGYSNGGGYADGIASADGSWHARLRHSQSGGCAPPFSSSTSCSGPFTRWGKATSANPTFPAGGYTTRVDVYLDTAWASANLDRRFDWSSAINNTAGNHLSDFAFNAGTTPTGFIIGASTNAFRSSTFPANPCPSPSTPPNSCRAPANITTSGWYTLQHTFRDNAGTLAVDMSILDSSGATVATWTIHSQPMANVGGDRYGWFANQEIFDLAIDNAQLIVDVPPNPPLTKDDCKKGGWMTFTDDQNRPFKNQGDCQSYFATKGKNKAAG